MSQAIHSETTDIEKLAAHRETLEILANSDLPIAPNCQTALEYLNKHETGGNTE